MKNILLCCGLLLFCGSARAQEGAPPPPVSDEFVSLFSDYCLQKFPDDAALATEAGTKNLSPLSAPEVRSFLHADPGVGWVITGQDTKYVLTVEQPPYHACAVRRYSDQPLDGAPLIAAARAFAAAQGHTLLAPQTLRRPIGNDIISSALFFQEANDKGQPVNQAFMFFMVSYPAAEKPDGTMSKPFWDIRFVRQMVQQNPI